MDGALWVTKKAPPRLRAPSSVRRANSSAAALPSAAPSTMRRRCLQRVHSRRVGASSTSPATARTTAVAAGIGINGLPILALEPDLDRYYYENVIGGPGAFVIAAQNYETFADAILKKLITKIAANER